MANIMVVPGDLLQERDWRTVIFLFQRCPKLNQYFTPEYFDLSKRLFRTTKIKKASAPWSTSEKFMLKLALCLFNGSDKPDLTNMSYLDSNNFALAIKAIEIRYGRG